MKNQEQMNILWSGIAYHSLENCVLTHRDESIDVNSVIVGEHDDKIYRVDYSIKINRNWECIFFEVRLSYPTKKSRSAFIAMEGEIGLKTTCQRMNLKVVLTLIFR